MEFGAQCLLAPRSVDHYSYNDIRLWLESAIDNLSSCMYQAVQHVWGEVSQGRRAVDRAVSIKRTTRCHGQLEAVRGRQKDPEVSMDQILRVYNNVQWPKWIMFPERIPA